MEDFGLFRGMGALDYSGTWEKEDCISEVNMEQYLNKDGIRYKMNRTKKEADETGFLLKLPGFEVNLPLIGKTYLG